MNKLIHICSHPRSGTNFLMDVVGQVFYPNRHLDTYNNEFGHWSKRTTRSYNMWGKLFDGHEFGHEVSYRNGENHIYIIRDVRGVMVSLYNCSELIHDRKTRIEFSEFLRQQHDFAGSPGRKMEPPIFNPIEHWKFHVRSWKRKTKALIISYEQLRKETDFIVDIISDRFGIEKKGQYERRFVGPSPSYNEMKYWEEEYSYEDSNFLTKQLRPMNLKGFLSDIKTEKHE